MGSLVLTASVAQATDLCEAMLKDAVVRAAVIHIDYGEDGGVGDVIVIKNGDKKPVENPRERPEMDIPRPEPQLEIIVPTPTRRKDEVPPSIIVPDLPVPVKKPPKPLPN